MTKGHVKLFARKIARAVLRRKILAILLEPEAGGARWGDLRRVLPINRFFGVDRGTPIDRIFIEDFLADNAAVICGNVLEVADNAYTKRFGGGRVIKGDVLHAVKGNPIATIVGDMCDPLLIPSERYDCVILTQTLQMIPDIFAAVRCVFRILRPGGTVLATVPGISQVSRSDDEQWGDLWRFTQTGARRLFEQAFPAELISVQAFGNVLTCVSFLHGLAAEELSSEELEFSDGEYGMLIAIKATRPHPMRGRSAA